MDKEVLKIIKLAVDLKKEEIDYYKKAAKKTKNPDGKKVFDYLAEEEEKHLEALKQHLASVERSDTWLLDEKLFNKSICKINRKKPEGIIPDKIKADASDLDALKQAVEIEKKAIQSYTDAACKAKDKKAMKILHFLIESEESHLKELEIQYAFLKSEGFWYNNEVTPT